MTSTGTRSQIGFGITGIDYTSDTTTEVTSWYSSNSSSDYDKYKQHAIDSYPIGDLIGLDDGYYSMGGGQADNTVKDLAIPHILITFYCKVI